jgi:hypothetical protein
MWRIWALLGYQILHASQIFRVMSRAGKRAGDARGTRGGKRAGGRAGGRAGECRRGSAHCVAWHVSFPLRSATWLAISLVLSPARRPFGRDSRRA